MPKPVLLIHNDPEIGKSVRLACEEIGVGLRFAPNADGATPLLESEEIGVVLCDASTFAVLRTRHADLYAVLIADRADGAEAIEWMMQGALDYVLQPLAIPALTRVISQALQMHLDVSVPRYEDLRPQADRIVGESAAMQAVYKLIGLLAPRDVNVLITGESGTGKDIVARAIHQHSLRKDGAFLAVNCAAIPETLLESELFGHEQGAFTGAVARRTGKFEQCHGGTLLLDEVGDIPLSTQAKLLRVLQDHSFQRLGGTDTVSADVRILAATHQPLEALIGEKRFRADLYYRLKVATIELPPLRDREVDVVLLAHYFVRRFSRQLQSDIRRFAPEAIPCLLKYPWPGNIRELENVIKASLVVARGSVLRPEHLPEKVRRAARRQGPAGPTEDGAKEENSHASPDILRRLAESLVSDPDISGRVHPEAVQRLERELIRACLVQAGGRVAGAARMLGMTRTTLRRKIASLGLEVRTSVESRDNPE